MNTRSLRAVSACLLIGACAPTAASAAERAGALDRPWLDRPVSDARPGTQATRTANRAAGRSQFSSPGGAQSTQPGLPGAIENFQVVSKLEPKGPGGSFGGVEDGQIADVATHKGFAYLNSWDDQECQRGGVHVVDITDPAKPQETGFIPAVQPYYHGEGAHAVSIATPQFSGDLLAVNNETYSAACGGTTKTGGGFDLYDVSDPRNPKVLVQVAGDKSPDGSLVQDPAKVPNSYHSVFVWQDGPRAYLVGVDNTELADVDVFDITDPRAPELIGDYDLAERFPQILDGEEGNAGNVFHHDAVVRKIAGRTIMLADYWDAGYVQLDVTDPRNPTLKTDSRFTGLDPLLPNNSLGLSPEGNAHQGEFSADGQFVLAADEDFNAFRSVAKAIDGPNEIVFDLLEGADSARIAGLPDRTLNGPTRYIGDGCDPATIPAAPADDGNANTEDVALIERGGTAPGVDPFCGFAVKTANVAAKGWDAAIVFNQAGRPDGDPFVNMTTDGSTIPAAFTLRAIALGTASEPGVIFPAAGGTTPTIGTTGRDVEVGAVFDGWGFAHLYDANTSQELGAYAIPEALDERYAGGNGPGSSFGDLSIHEFATDPDTNLAYASYYAGGLRAFQFSRAGGLVETAKFVDPEGSNFWGVEQFTGADGKRYVAGSDRDFGLVILRYTGPGAENTGVKPSPSPPAVTPPALPPGPKKNTDSTFTLKRGAFKRNRFTVTLTTKGAGISSAELTAKIGSRKVRLVRRAVTHGGAGAKSYTVRLTSASSQQLRRAIRRTKAKRITGTLRLAFTAAGESKGKVQTTTLTLR